MRLDEAADEGKRRRREGALAAEAQGIAHRRAQEERDRQRLDLAYGIDEDARATGIYLVVLAVAGAIGTAWAMRSLPRASDTLPWVYAISAALGLIGAYLIYAGTQAPKKRAAERAWLHSFPFPFDVAGYERALIEHDFMTGWLRVTLRFAPSRGAAQKEKLANAALGFGAAEAVWVGDDVLRLRSPQLDTRVRTKNSNEDSARPLHVWFRKFAALPDGPLVTLASARKVERVSARIGWFSDGSWTVSQKEADDDALEPATPDEDPGDDASA